MTDIDIIKLEDSKEYMVIDIIDSYFYLTSTKDPQDFCIRKLKDDSNPILILLDNKNEFNKAIKLFTEKNKNYYL